MRGVNQVNGIEAAAAGLWKRVRTFVAAIGRQASRDQGHGTHAREPLLVALAFIVGLCVAMVVISMLAPEMNQALARWHQ